MSEREISWIIRKIFQKWTNSYYDYLTHFFLLLYMQIQKSIFYVYLHITGFTLPFFFKALFSAIIHNSKCSIYNIFFLNLFCNILQLTIWIRIFISFSEYLRYTFQNCETLFNFFKRIIRVKCDQMISKF